jgi:PAS domain S-box-containing protein
MNPIDMKTVIISYVISNAICAAVITALWIQNRRRFTGIGFWLADFAMQFIALLLVALRDKVPDWVSMTASNALIIAGTFLLYVGLERFTGKRSRQVHNVALTVVYVFAHAYFVLVDPNLSVRNLIFSLGLLAACSQCAWLLLYRVEAETRSATRGMGILFVVYCAVSIVRIIVGAITPSTENFFDSNVYDTLLVMLYQMLFIILTFNLFLLVNRRLFSNLEHDVIAREKAEMTARQSEERYQAFIEQSFESVYRTEFDHPIDILLPAETQIDLIYENAYMAECNQALATMYGLPSVESMIGTRLIDLHGGKDNPINRAALRKFIESGYKSTNDETVEVDLNGNSVWLMSNTIGMVADGHLIRMWGTSIKTTERKMTEEALQASEERFRQLIMSAPDAVFGVNKEGKITFANEEATRLLGYSLDEFAGMEMDQLVPPQQETAAIQPAEHFSNPAARFAGFGFDVIAKHKEGSEIPVDIRISELKTNAGVLTIAFVRDITQQKLIEERLRQQAELIELAHAAVIVYDMKGQIRYWNPNARSLYGWMGKEVIGKLVYQVLQTQYPIPRDEIEQALLISGYWDGELTHTCKDGGKVIVSSHQAVQRDAQGNPVSVLELNLDITERVQKDADLREAQIKIMENQRVMASFEERERLARELHDSIGQTFGYINLQSEAIREHVGKGDRESSLSMLARLSEVAQESHRDVRAYIQELKSNTPIIHQEFFAALDKYCKHYEQAYLFHVQLNLPKSLPEVLASPQVETHLTYIIREALGNARRYSGEKQASISVQIDDEYVQAIIEDHGAGFNSEYDEPEQRKRPHFGLRIMRERAEEVGGTVAVESAPSKGTRVIIHLPRKLSAGASLAARIMIADDHPLFVDGLRNMLAARGVNVLGAAKDGLEAQEMVRALKPDIILMDIHMPRMNGLEATRLIKAEIPDVKVAMLTTSVEQDDIFEALQAGASGYLLKGMSADEFMTRLGEIARGEAEFSAKAANQMLEMLKTSKVSKASETLSGLTERQSEILSLVAQGLLYKEIGDRLFLTERTVKYHMGEILARLHLKGRQEAEEYAKRRGLK